MAGLREPDPAMERLHESECGAAGRFEDHRVSEQRIIARGDPIALGQEPLHEVRADGLCAAHDEMHIAQWSFPGTANPRPVTGAVPAAVNPPCMTAERL